MNLHVSDKITENDDGCSLFLELPEDDPLFEKKKKLMKNKGFDPCGHAYFSCSSSPNWLNSTLDLMIQRARIIQLDEVKFILATKCAKRQKKNC